MTDNQNMSKTSMKDVQQHFLSDSKSESNLRSGVFFFFFFFGSLAREGKK